MKNKTIFAFFIVVCFTACEHNEAYPETKLVIDHYLYPINVEFSGSAIRLAYRTQTDNEIGTDQWRPRGFVIQGLDYEWGYVYELIVKKEKEDHSVMDGPVIYTIVKEISRKKIPENTSFEIPLVTSQVDPYRTDPYLLCVHGDLASGFKLAEKVSIDCGDLCVELSEAIESGTIATGVFNHTPDGIKLIAIK